MARFLLKRVILLVICMQSIAVCSQNTEIVSTEVFGQEHCKSDAKPTFCGSTHDFGETIPNEALQTFGNFLNNEKESPRKNVYSILQFFGTLLTYICGVLLRNIRRSRNIFNTNVFADRVKELVTQSVKDLYALKKESPFRTYSCFRDNFLFANRKEPLQVFYFFESESQRAVSFVDLKNSSPVSILHLARSGFYYTKSDDLVKCFGCGKQVRLMDFDNDEPSNRKFHASTSCPFLLSASVSPSLFHEALDSEQRSPIDYHNADTSERFPFSSLEEETNSRPPRKGDATGGGQLSETAIRSLTIASSTGEEEPTAPNCPQTPCHDISHFVSCFGGADVASTLQKVESTKVPHESSRSTKEGKERWDFYTKPSASDEYKPGFPRFSSYSSAGTSSGLDVQIPASPSCSADSGNNKYDNTGARPKAGPSLQEQLERDALENDDQSNSDKFYWADRDCFEPECFYSKSESKRNAELLWTDACPKNEIHDGFFAVDKVTTTQLPDSMQSVDFQQFMITAANLTVKLYVKFTSADRPGNNTGTKKRGFNRVSRYGSGFAFSETEKDKAEDLIRKFKENSPKPKTKKVKNFLPHPVGKPKKSYFSIQTARHLVFDNSEAKHTEVIFEIQDGKSRNVKRYRGKGVFAIHDKVEGNYRTLLLCKSSEPELANALEKERRDFTTLKQALPQEVMTELLEECFVISHPHGLNKTVTFGQSTIVKYALRQQGQDEVRRQFERLTKNEKETSIQDIREILMYTAGTCPGSSGGPVFSCRNIRERPGEDMRTQLVLWIHNGEEKESGLSCTLMNSYQPELTERSSFLPLNKSPSAPTEDESNDLVGPESVGPHAPPFITMESRLASYKNGYKSECKHSPLELSEAGFYFTGDGDCLKCFCCGLGLKGWNSLHDIYEEHNRRRPDCNFLKAHLDTQREIQPALLFDETEKTDQAFRITLLKSERKKLASRLICKVCWKYPASELFLACGDVFACERCSTFLYTCPVCDKAIYATVTAYLS